MQEHVNANIQIILKNTVDKKKNSIRKEARWLITVVTHLSGNTNIKCQISQRGQKEIIPMQKLKNKCERTIKESGSLS